MQFVGALVRFHRRGLPLRNDAAFSGLDRKQREELLRLMGILRLANQLDANHRGKFRDLTVTRHDGSVSVNIRGWSAISREAEQVARARYLLETACHRPIALRGLRSPARVRVKAARARTRAAQAS